MDAHSLYLRAARVLVGERGGDLREFKLRTKFVVTNDTVGQQTNKAQISLYNLSQDSRNFIERLSNPVMQLFAGYNPNAEDNPVLPMLFAGDIYYPHNERQGADVITTLESGMQQFFFNNAHMEFSQQTTMTPDQILRLIKAKLNAFGVAVGDLSVLVSSPYLLGFCFSGPVTDMLDNIVKPLGLLWSFQENALVIFDPKDPPVAQGVLLSEQTGMIGFPTTSAGNTGSVVTADQNESLTTPIFTVKSLLNAELVPGKQVQLKSQDAKYNGFFLVRKATHTGDTLEGDYVTEVEGQWIISNGVAA